MKILDFEMIRNVCKDISPHDYLMWINNALCNKNKFLMPNKTRMNQIDGDYYAVMPCLYEKENIAMVKMIGRHSIKRNEKRSIMMSDILLYEADTGILKAIMDGEYITTLRTGTAAAQAALMYGKKNFHVIGLIGLGNIMSICLMVLLNELKNRKLVIKLYKHNGQENRIVEKFKNYKNIEFILCNTYEETIKGSEVIISAVTRVTENFCDDSYFDEGCTVIPVMTLGFQNCDLFFDKVFTDEIEQIKNFKYFDYFKYIANTSEVMNGTKKGRVNDRERILVYYYGLAIHDLLFAMKIYSRCKLLGEYEYCYCREKFFV